MSPFVDVFVIVSFVAVAQGMIIGLFLVLGKAKIKKASITLALIVFILSYTLLHHTLAYSGLMIFVPEIYGTGAIFSYTLGPLVFLCIKYVIKKNKTFNYLDLLHFLPFIVYQFYKMPHYFYQTELKKSMLLNSLNNMYGLQNNDGWFTDFLIFDIHTLIYMLVTFWYVRTIEKKGKAKDVNFGLLNQFILGALLVWVLFSIAYPVYEIEFGKSELFWLAPSLGIAILILVLAFASMRDSFDLIRGNSKYNSSKLSEGLANKYLDQLRQCLEEDQIYLNPNLLLSDVSDKMSVNSKYVSQIINEKLETSFNDLINKYRVNHSSKLLSNPEFDRYTLDAISEMSGFKSRDVFYKSFKKNYDQTPLQFKKSR